MFVSSDFGIQIYLLNSITVNLHTLLETAEDGGGDMEWEQQW